MALKKELKKMSDNSNVAIEEETTIEKEELFQYVTFKIGDEDFAIDIIKVQEIIREVEVTEVPQSHEFIDGIASLRGKVMPIISLRMTFGLPKLENDNDNRVLVTDLNGVTVGLVVDSVSEILRLSPKDIEPPPHTAGSDKAEYIKGVGKIGDRLLIILDIDKVLTMQESEALGSLEAGV